MPVGTSTSGVDGAGDVQVYVPPGVSIIDRGTSLVSYGPVLTLNPGDPFPGTGLLIVDIQSGELQADNQVFIRTVTITPAGP